MVALTTPKALRAISRLPFCYLCGQQFVAGDKTNRDHVPPESAFAIEHRRPLLLRTHLSCNKAHELVDEKMGQLLGLRVGRTPRNPGHRRLRVRTFELPEREGDRFGAVTNVDVKAAVWRWVRGFHAALYREYLPSGTRRAVELPFPDGEIINGDVRLSPVREQHAYFVQIIKMNREAQNLDRIVSNVGAVTYECVWGQMDHDSPWLCVFALDIYDWRDLGEERLGQRGCVGMYQLDKPPAGATMEIRRPRAVPNTDPLNPFGG
jgi:hypothetical protein